MNLENKVALVTGASSGIGQAIAIDLAKEKAIVIINYRKNKKGAEDTLKVVNKYSQGQIIQADISKKDEVIKMFGEIKKSYGQVDILVNNAGESIPGKLGDMDVWKYQLENTLLSCVLTTNEFTKLKNSNQRKIVNISSIYGSNLGGNTNYLAYCAAKAAMNNLTVNLAKMHGNKILVNAVAPGWTWTPPWGDDRKTEEKFLKDKVTIERFVEPNEIAQMVIAILKNDAVTGQIVTVEGGATLKELY